MQTKIVNNINIKRRMTFHCERGVDNGTISDLGKVLAHYEVLKSKELSAGGNLSQKGL